MGGNDHEWTCNALKFYHLQRPQLTFAESFDCLGVYCCGHAMEGPSIVWRMAPLRKAGSFPEVPAIELLIRKQLVRKGASYSQRTYHGSLRSLSLNSRLFL